MSQHLNWAGFFQIALLILWFPCCGMLGAFVSWRSRRESAVRLPPIGDPVAPTPLHVHILDLHRGEFTITDEGGIHARCCMAGCSEAFYVTPSTAQMYIGERVSVRR